MNVIIAALIASALVGTGLAIAGVYLLMGLPAGLMTAAAFCFYFFELLKRGIDDDEV